jgi:hypothetical protein
MTDIRFMVRYAIFKLSGDAVRNRLEKPSRLVIKTPGYTDLFMGLGGVLVRPEYFDDVAFDITRDFMFVDDVWLSGMLARKDVPIWTPANIARPQRSDVHYEAPLARSTIDGVGRRAANEKCFTYLQETYGIWP